MTASRKRTEGRKGLAMPQYYAFFSPRGKGGLRRGCRWSYISPNKSGEVGKGKGRERGKENPKPFPRPLPPLAARGATNGLSLPP